MSKRKNNRLGKAGITFYTYATERIREKRLAGKHNTADLYSCLLYTSDAADEL